VTGPLSDEMRSALSTVLEPNEHVMRVAPAVGCTLVLTELHLHLVRDGVTFRPRTGIQTWVLDRSLSVRMTPVRQSSGRLIVAAPGHNASVFITGAHAPEVEALLAEIRSRIYKET
jgi:hypothetical protein